MSLESPHDPSLQSQTRPIRRPTRSSSTAPRSRRLTGHQRLEPRSFVHLRSEDQRHPRLRALGSESQPTRFEPVKPKDPRAPLEDLTCSMLETSRPTPHRGFRSLDLGRLKPREPAARRRRAPNNPSRQDSQPTAETIHPPLDLETGSVRPPPRRGTASRTRSDRADAPKNTCGSLRTLSTSNPKAVSESSPRRTCDTTNSKNRRP